jgi:hypothetical protein
MMTRMALVGAAWSFDRSDDRSSAALPDRRVVPAEDTKA